MQSCPLVCHMRLCGHLLPVPQLLVESEKQCSDLDEINEKIKSNLKKVKLQFASKLVDIRKLKTKNVRLYL